MIEGMILLWALFGAVKGAVKAVAGAAAGGARNGAAAAGRRTATARSHPNRAVRGVGHAAHATGAVAGGVARGAWAGGRAAAQGAREGWAQGKEQGRRRAETAPERREVRDERRRQRQKLRDARRKGADRRRQPRTTGPETERTDPADGPSGDGAPRQGQTEPVNPSPGSQPDGGPTAPAAPGPGNPIRFQPPAARPPRNEGENNMAGQTNVPTGEVQGKADTEKALAAYRGVATTYQDLISDLNNAGGEMLAMANRLCGQLEAAELGERTMQAVAAVQEQADVANRDAALCGPAGEAVLAELTEFEAAVAAHDAVEAAAIANQDGGTTDWHADGGRSHTNVNNDGPRDDGRVTRTDVSAPTR